MCMFETQKRTNKQTQQILKDIIQDNISGIKINTHHKQTCKNILSMSFFVTLQHLGENVLDFNFFDDWQDHGMVLKSCINRTDGNLSMEIRSL